MSPTYRSHIRQVLERVRKHQRGVAMTVVDYAFLERLADFWKARPAMANGKPIALNAVLNTLRVGRAYFS